MVSVKNCLLWKKPVISTIHVQCFKIKYFIVELPPTVSGFLPDRIYCDADTLHWAIFLSPHIYVPLRMPLRTSPSSWHLR
mmetsp:Transcript_20838/g.32232  ORF Transcript_20838/g.32232 Transcript_20838/m.32232 type:complete len:80 (+) Transcript_20838:56-295(+)